MEYTTSKLREQVEALLAKATPVLALRCDRSTTYSVKAGYRKIYARLKKRGVSPTDITLFAASTSKPYVSAFVFVLIEKIAQGSEKSERLLKAGELSSHEEMVTAIAEMEEAFSELELYNPRKSGHLAVEQKKVLDKHSVAARHAGDGHKSTTNGQSSPKRQPIFDCRDQRPCLVPEGFLRAGPGRACQGTVLVKAMFGTPKKRLGPSLVRVCSKASVFEKLYRRDCETIIQARVSSLFTENGPLGAGLIAGIGFSKYLDGPLLYRQSVIQEREGIGIAHAAHAKWVGHYAWWVSPLAVLIRTYVLVAVRFTPIKPRSRCLHPTRAPPG